MRLSGVIPAYNEDRYIGATLASIAVATSHLKEARPSDSVEVLVVDNDSDDRTSEIAAEADCRVVHELEHNISKVRNQGAKESDGDVVVFIDADTLVPAEALKLIAEALDDSTCVGGAVDVHHKPAKLLMKCYVAVWRILGRLSNMAQGATQFCRRAEFFQLGGYDETIFMGEDCDFYWRMNRLAKTSARHITLIKKVRVVPSPRRYDQWSIWRTLVETNPLFILLFWKTKNAWSGWYEDRPQ